MWSTTNSLHAYRAGAPGRALFVFHHYRFDGDRLESQRSSVNIEYINL